MTRFDGVWRGLTDLLRGHSARRGIVTTKVIRALEEGSDGVVGHVDRGITQRLNYPLVIPRKLNGGLVR